jgi:tetratricopeptide (TPR) repeat protein
MANQSENPYLIRLFWAMLNEKLEDGNTSGIYPTQKQLNEVEKNLSFGKGYLVDFFKGKFDDVVNLKKFSLVIQQYLPSYDNWNDFAAKENIDTNFESYFTGYNRDKEKIDNAVKQRLRKVSPTLAKHLTSPPFDAPVFLGRDLNTIKAKLAEVQQPLLLMNGEGGIGKTTFAAKYWHANQAEYQYMAYLEVRQNLCTTLLQLAPVLGLQFDPAMPDEQRLKLLLQALAALPKRCLLLIDNANDREDLALHYQTLDQLSNFDTLITTRVNTLGDAAVLKIDPLAKNDIVLLFAQHYPALATAEHPLLHTIIEAVGRNTLVVELLAKNLKKLNQLNPHYTLGNLLADLQRKGLLAMQSRPVETHYHSPSLGKAKPEDIIQAMYDLTALSYAEVALLSNLAVLPTQIGFALLNALLSPDKPDTLADTLETLHEKGWIELHQQGYKSSPVVQEVVRNQNKESLYLQNRQLIQNLKWFLESDGAFLKNGTYTQHWPYIDIAAGVCQYLPIDGELHFYLAHSYQHTGRLSQAIETYTHAQRLLENSDKPNYAISYERLGSIYQAQGKWEQALKYFEDETKLFEELYEKNPQSESLKNGLAISYSKLGSIYQAKGNWEQALKYFEDFKDLMKELYEKNPQSESLKNGLAISYSKLGSIYQAKGKREMALKYFEDDLKLTKELYEKNPQSESLKNGLAISYERLGSIYQAQGKWEQALKYFEDETKLFEELYEKNPQSVALQNGLAISYYKIGGLYNEQQDATNARIYFLQAQQIWQTLTQAVPQAIAYKRNLAVIDELLGE